MVVKNTNFSQIKITVADTGLGIDEKNLVNLFHAFSKIQNKEDSCLNAQGVGLGLLISHKLADLLNKSEGGINVVSKYNSGSEFSFKLYDLTNNDEINSSSRRASFFNSPPCRLFKNQEENILTKEKLLQISLSTYISNNLNESQTRAADEYKIDISEDKCLKPRPSEISLHIDQTDDFKKNCESPLLIRNRVEKIRYKIKKKVCTCPVALIIDDNDFNILSMKAHLKKFGMPCDSAINGKIAIQTILRMHENNCCKIFKYIFLDLEMPGKNGLVIYEEISEYYKSLGGVDSLIILNTGYSLSSDIVKEALAKGIKNILIKPITQRNLIQIIDPFNINY